MKKEDLKNYTKDELDELFVNLINEMDKKATKYFRSNDISPDPTIYAYGAGIMTFVNKTCNMVDMKNQNSPLNRRQELINKFHKLFQSNPREGIAAALCANIAEEYHEKLSGTSNDDKFPPMRMASLVDYKVREDVEENKYNRKAMDLFAENCMLTFIYTKREIDDYSEITEHDLYVIKKVLEKFKHII